MIIQKFSTGPFATNSYILVCPRTCQAGIIDPAPDSYLLIRNYLLKNHLIPDKILLTHSHWDHIADTAPIKKEFKLPVYVHPLDVPNLENPGSDGLPCWIDIEGVVPDVLLKEDDVIGIGDLSFTVIHTPGHTPGGVCFYNKVEGVLMSGDTLFREAIGNLSFPTAQPNLMWGSLKKLSTLPEDTKVFPGHGESTTIGNEKWLPNAEEFFGTPPEQQRQSPSWRLLCDN